MTANLFKRALAEGRQQIGLWQGLASTTTAEICAGAGFDWLLFDGEHAPNTIPTLLAQLQAVAPYPVQAVARPPVAEPWLIKQYLDIGYQTLLLPMVADAEQAAEIGRAMRYPPAGTRGVGAALARASRWNRRRDYLHCADEEICTLVQVETVEALNQIEAISRVDGVDGIFIGPSDLAASMGYIGNPGHVEVQAAVEAAIAAIVSTGKPAGILTADVAAARKYLELGCLFVAVGTDAGLLSRAVDDLARQFLGDGSAPPPAAPSGPY